MSSSLLLQQCPACLVRLTRMVWVICGRWPYSCFLVGCCFHVLFRITRSILVQLPSSLFSSRFVRVQVVQPYSSTAMTTTWKRYLGSNISSTENDVNARIGKTWSAINKLSVIWKSNLIEKLKRQFFQAVVVSVLLYGCTTWTLTKRLENKLDWSCTRMLRVILNKTWKQHPTRKQLYGHLPHITQTIRVRRTRHAGHC